MVVAVAAVVRPCAAVVVEQESRIVWVQVHEGRDEMVARDR
jgi:hypothetical protein